ncbi:MAG: hypothetical protein MI754_16545, partial [Chromatiales bacterium]|nr:hypothetical protein [Chromatiales bacterium]
IGFGQFHGSAFTGGTATDDDGVVVLGHDAPCLGCAQASSNNSIFKKLMGYKYNLIGRSVLDTLFFVSIYWLDNGR